jgi:O-acetyl-ADP-ribose deacetylase (regulator of RNase III)
MKAEYIIHVNGPKFHEPGTEEKLRRATQAALKQADEKRVQRVAFPPIGTGLYQVPLDLCARVMVGAVEEHLRSETGLEEVLFVALDAREYKPFEDMIEGGA